MKPNYLLMLTCVLLLANCSKTAKEEPTNETVVAEPAPSPEVQEPDSIATTTDTTETTTTDEEPSPPTAPPTPATQGGSMGTSTVSEVQMSTVLEQIARDIEKDSLEYRADLGQDCSGIYHKIKDMVQRRITALGDETKYHYPQFNTDRSSRQIANWYHQNGNLHIVQNAMADRNLIRPGSVMFYGRTDESYSNLDITLLANADKFFHDGTNGKIMHIAVVTSVEKDDAGNLSKYTIMHGRNKRYTASRSAGNWDGPGGYKTAFAKFPFGNWNQQWVAVANIETPK